MKCPSCHRPVDEEAASCYSCGYGIVHARSRFGSREVKMKRVHDAADCLRVQETRDILEAMRQLEATFPQLVFSVFVGELGLYNISELGFWLINHARADVGDTGLNNDHVVLLIIDIEKKRAGIALGYFSEMVLDEDDCVRALMAGRSSLLNEEYGEGAVTILQKTGRQLERRARQLRKLSRDEQMERLIEERLSNSLALPPHFVQPHFGEPAREKGQSEERPIGARKR